MEKREQYEQKYFSEWKIRILGTKKIDAKSKMVKVAQEKLDFYEDHYKNNDMVELKSQKSLDEIVTEHMMLEDKQFASLSRIANKPEKKQKYQKFESVYLAEFQENSVVSVHSDTGSITSD